MNYFLYLLMAPLFEGRTGWLAAVPPRVGFAGWLFGGMASKPLFLNFSTE
jgi:hypothetical protein